MPCRVGFRPSPLLRTVISHFHLQIKLNLKLEEPHAQSRSLPTIYSPWIERNPDRGKEALPQARGSLTSSMHKEKQDIPSIYKSLSIKSILVWVKDKESVEILKTKVQQRVGLPIAEQKLISEGKMLRDKRTLKDYKISRGSSLSLISGLRGGTTPGPSFSYKEPARIGAKNQPELVQGKLRLPGQPERTQKSATSH